MEKKKSNSSFSSFVAPSSSSFVTSSSAFVAPSTISSSLIFCQEFLKNKDCEICNKTPKDPTHLSFYVPQLFQLERTSKGEDMPFDKLLARLEFMRRVCWTCRRLYFERPQWNRVIKENEKQWGYYLQLIRTRGSCENKSCGLKVNDTNVTLFDFYHANEQIRPTLLDMIVEGEGLFKNSQNDFEIAAKNCEMYCTCCLQSQLLQKRMKSLITSIQKENLMLKNGFQLVNQKWELKTKSNYLSTIDLEIVKVPQLVPQKIVRLNDLTETCIKWDAEAKLFYSKSNSNFLAR
jgi:hypothetical protein